MNNDSTLSPREFRWRLIQSNAINLAIVLLFPMAAMLVYFAWNFKSKHSADWNRLFNGVWAAIVAFTAFAVAPHFVHTLVVDVLVSAFGQPSRRRVLVALSINMALVLAILSLFTMSSIKVLFAAVPYGLAIGYGQYLRWRYVCCLLERSQSDKIPAIYNVVELTYVVLSVISLFAVLVLTIQVAGLY